MARSRGRGGGVGLLFKRTLSVKVTPVKVTSFECMDACITSGKETLRLIVVYKLHPKKGITNTLFFEECADVVSKQMPLPGQLVILGDFNLHWNKPSDDATVRFKDILDSFDLIQAIRWISSLHVVMMRQCAVSLSLT